MTSTATPALPPATPPLAVKIVVTGTRGAGKTTFIRSISEIATVPAVIHRTRHTNSTVQDAKPSKTSVSTWMDVGRITLDPSLVLYLFGTDRQGVLRDEISRGAAGAVILADTGRGRDALAAIDYCEKYSIPYIVACDRAGDEDATEALEALRTEIGLSMKIVTIAVDVHARESVKTALVNLLEHALADRTQSST